MTSGRGHPALSDPRPTTHRSRTSLPQAPKHSPHPKRQLQLRRTKHYILRRHPGVPSGVIGYNVYASKVQGREALQTRVPLSLSQYWEEGVNGLLTGAPPPTTPGTSYQVSSDYNVFQTINGLNDGQLHVGNAPCPAYVRKGLRTDPNDFCPPGSKSPFVQFYKEYPAQIVLCVNTADGKFNGHDIVSFPTAVKKKVDAATADDQSNARSKAEAGTVVILGAHGGGAQQQPSGGTQTSGGVSGASAGASSSGSGNAAGAMSQVTLNLQPSRISAMVSKLNLQHRSNRVGPLDRKGLRGADIELHSHRMALHRGGDSLPGRTGSLQHPSPEPN